MNKRLILLVLSVVAVMILILGTYTTGGKSISHTGAWAVSGLLLVIIGILAARRR